MDVQIDTALKRARGYWFIDGFTEMAAGGLFVILAGILLFSGYAPQASFLDWFLSVTSEIVIVKLIGILVAILILWWLKDHFTYPRTGFVRGKRVTATQVLVIIRNVILFLLLPILVLLAASLLIASAPNVLASMPVWFPIGLGLISGGAYLLAGEWMGLRRFRLLAVTIALTGIAMGVWQFTMGFPTFPSNNQSGIFQPVVLETINRTLISLGFLILISGVTLMISGLATFLRYRKENPTPYAEEIMSGSLQNLSGLDRVIHEPARLMLVALLSSVESADFLFLLKESGLTKGNLSVHLSRLEEAGYLRVDKTFKGKIPHTEYSLTAKGKTAFNEYRKKLDPIIRRPRR